MKLIKRIFSLASSLAVGATLFCGTNVFSATAVQGVLTYEIENAKAYVTACTEDATTVEIPATYNGYPVISVTNDPFENCKALTAITVNSASRYFSSINGVLFDKNAAKIVRYPEAKAGAAYAIPSSTTGIGYNAFSACTNLTSITIPSSVTDIGYNAFSNCTNLASITIPNSVTDIRDHAFFCCEKLSSVKLSANIKSIAACAFADCKSLTSITIPAGVTAINSDAFNSCTKLSSVTIPNSVTKIGSGAFGYCEALSRVTIPQGVKSIGDYAFSCCFGLTSVTIPDGVTAIGLNGFSRCTKLSSVTIPNSVTAIGNNAFGECSSSLHINSRAGTTANTYATNNGISFVTVIYGNAYDGDSIVSLKDLSKLAKYIAQISTLTPQQMLNADVYYDGVVDIKDLSKMQSYIAGYNVTLGPSL